MKNISPLELSRILINGYEVKETPEEKWAKEYELAISTGENMLASFNDRYEAMGVIKTIQGMTKDFNIKIKGINE